jgi:predicted esterase YcpF (UPF0227 family)
VSAPHLLYLHGFLSSSRSTKARQLDAYLRERGQAKNYLCPDLPHRPAAAKDLLESLLNQYDQAPTLIGSSLGGFYATDLAERFGLRAVVINPAITPHQGLRPYVGKQQNLYSGEKFEFTEQHLDELAALWHEQLHPERYLLLHETGDELLDYRVAMRRYRGAAMYIVEGGSHNFDCFEECIPRILDFANR